MTRNRIVGDEPCPRCRENGGDLTGNHLIVFDNGNKYCNRCKYTETKKKKESILANNQLTIDEINKYTTRGYRDADAEILEQLGVRVGLSTTNGTVESVFYPVHHVSGDLIGYKQRKLPKKFYTIGSMKGVPKQFFGQQTVGEGGKLLVIVEGEDDVLLGRQILKELKRPYNLVGLPFGVSSAEQIVRDNINWLESFEDIVLILDQDEPGINAAKVMANILTQGKVKIGKHTEKDVCDLYQAGKAQEFLNAIWKSKVYTPKGIVSARNHKSEFFREKPENRPIPYPEVFSSLASMTDHARRGELVLLTGGTGSGKSQMVDQMIHHWMGNKYRVGAIKMEHNVDRNIENLLSVYMGVNLKIPELKSQLSPEDIDTAYDDFYGTDNLYLIDHSVELSDESIFDQIRYLAVSARCDVIVIDHIHAIMYEEADSDENKRMDTLLRQLWRMAQQYGVSIHAVAHPRKSGSGGKSAEEGGFITLDDLKGSSALKQVPDIILSGVRDSTAEDEDERCTAQVYVLKNRWLGHTGPADKIIFDVETCNYSKINPQSEEY